MQSYINQLLEDMEHAHRKEDSTNETNTFPFNMEDEFEAMERWINHDPVHTFGYYCELEKVQFPPSEMLSKKQMLQISKAFQKLLFSWNLGAAFPKKLPLANKYTLLIGLLDKKTDIVRDGFMDFDFCTCDPPSCPFGDYCQCKKWETEISADKKMDSKSPDIDIPF